MQALPPLRGARRTLSRALLCGLCELCVQSVVALF